MTTFGDTAGYKTIIPFHKINLKFTLFIWIG